MRCIVFVFVLAGCARPILVTPGPDAQDAQPLAVESAAPDLTGCTGACANLVRLRCPEGLRSNCETSCRHGEEITDFKTACLAEAGTVDDVRRCGTLGRDGGCAL